MIGSDLGSAPVGSYSPVVLTSILRRTAVEARTGALHVVSGASVKSVHFEKGTIRFAASNVPKDRLGESMLAHDFISRKDYELARAKMERERCRFGEALMQLGRLTEEQLQRELAIQVQRIVLSLFRISAGTYSFEGHSRPGTPALPFGLSVPALLLKGLRVVDDGRLILSALPSADTRVRAVSHPLCRLDLKKLSSAEKTVLDLAKDEIAIGEIVRSSGLGRNAAFRSCFTMLAVGLLETIPESGTDGSATATDQEPARERIELEFARLAAAGDGELLGIAPDASLDEIQEAYDCLKSEWAELRERTSSPELLQKLEAIDLRLGAAAATLRFERESRSALVEPGVRERVTRPEEKSPRSDPHDFARRQRMEQLERDARLHVQVRDWNGAVSLLHELVALEPQRAEFQWLLGKSMQHVASMRKNAEQHLLEAVSLSPRDATYLLDLARYHLGSGNRSKALGELQSVLALDPANAEATRLLGSFRELTPMKKLLKRVFG